MVVAPALAVIGSTVAIGLYMGWRYLRGERNNRILVGFHLVLGVIGLEAERLDEMAEQAARQFWKYL